MNIDELKKMSTVERLQAMEALWDSMLYENKKIETPKWHEVCNKNTAYKTTPKKSNRLFCSRIDT